jgi:hypothetical protein
MHFYDIANFDFAACLCSGNHLVLSASNARLMTLNVNLHLLEEKPPVSGAALNTALQVCYCCVCVCVCVCVNTKPYMFGVFF